MNKIILLVATATLLTQALQAQIKRQYKDEKFAEQTVVIKEEKSMSDIEILNSQFDMDEVALGEVIRITTETVSEKTSEVTEQPSEEIVAVVVPEPQEVVEEEEEETDIKESIKPIVQSKSRNNNNYSKSKKIKRKNPRFKKQKRKRVKNHKKKCYSF